MANRTVAVELTLGTAGYQRGAVQAEQSNRRIAATAVAAGAEADTAFQRSASGVQSAMERAARTTQTTSRTMQESAARTSTALGRMAVSAEEVPAAFSSAASVSTRAAGQIASAAETSAAAQTGAYARAAAAARSWASSVQTSSAAGARALVRAGEEGEKAFTGIRTAGLLLLGAFAAASLTAAKFEKSMSGVAAVSDATAEQMTQLRDAALEAGRATSFTASQAADAEAELARAGVSVADIVGGALRGALSLAAAGQLSLSEAATISAQAMNTFGLRGKDVAHVADVLAAGANKSASDVHGLGESLRMGGLLAHQTGLSLEDTVGVLSAFADHALIGSDAGTSLKVMLQRLVPQSGEAADMMQKLNFTAYDAQGNFVGLSELAARMKTSFGQLTPEARNAAMATIFGSDAVRSATILYEQGAAGIDRYRKAVDDQGAAERMARVQMDNLAGDLEALKGSIEVALIQSGTEANKVLREMTQVVTAVVNAYSALPPWAQTTATALMGVVGALALAAGGFMLILPRIAAFQTSLATLATTMPRLTAAASATTSFLTGPWGIALGIAVAALGVFGAANSSAKKATEGLTDAVKADGAAVGANTRAWLAHELETRGVLQAAQALGVSTEDVTSAVLGQADALARVKARLAEVKPSQDDVARSMHDGTDATHGQAAAYEKVDRALTGLSADLNKSVESAKREGEAAGGAAASTKDLGGAAKMTAGELADARTEADKLKDSLDKLNGVNISAAESAIRYQKGLQDLRDAVKENGHALDITTESGRAVKEAFLGAASAAQAHAEAVMKQTGSSEKAQITLAQDVEALKATMKAAGFTTAQIESLTAAYAQLPATKQTVVTDPGALQTIKDLQTVQAKLDGIPPGKSITVSAPSAAAIQDLEAIGYKVEHLPDGKVKVTVPTNDAFDGVTRIQEMINGISRNVNVVVRIDGERNQHGPTAGYANGGMIHAASGYTIPGYAPRRDTVPLMASPGESVLVPETTRKLGGENGISALNAWGRYGTPPPPGLIPAGQFVAVAAAGGGGDDRSRTVHIHLDGAGQQQAELVTDLTRTMQFVS